MSGGSDGGVPGHLSGPEALDVTRVKLTQALSDRLSASHEITSQLIAKRKQIEATLSSHIELLKWLELHRLDISHRLSMTKLHSVQIARHFSSPQRAEKAATPRGPLWSPLSGNTGSARSARGPSPREFSRKHTKNSLDDNRARLEIVRDNTASQLPAPAEADDQQQQQNASPRDPVAEAAAIAEGYVTEMTQNAIVAFDNVVESGRMVEQQLQVERQRNIAEMKAVRQFIEEVTVTLRRLKKVRAGLTRAIADKRAALTVDAQTLLFEESRFR